MSGMNTPDLRIQDLVGALSGVKLKQVSKTFRTLSLVLRHGGHTELADELDEIFAESAIAGEYIAPLHSRPERINFDAADAVRSQMLSDPEIALAIEHIRELSQDPYYGRNTAA